MNMNRNTRRNSERARAITKAKARKTNILLASAAIALVAVVAVSIFAFSGFNTHTNNTGTPNVAPTTISMKANENKAAQNTKQEAQTATQAPQQEQKAAQPAAQTSNDNTAQAAQSDTQQNVQNNAQQNTQNNTQNTAQNNTKSEDRIDKVNGERIYVDTKRTAPEKTGTPAVYYAYGKTSYGFDWDYKADNGNFVLNGGYNFDQQQYIFTFYGTTPGVSHVTLYYNTDDNTQVPVNLTVTVDNDLNVSVG